MNPSTRPSQDPDRIVFEREDRGADVEAMEREIFELSAHINAATYRLLSLIAEFDRREGWTGWGVLSCAHWLNWKCGIGLNAAREKVRVAHALAELPVVSEAFARGAVSYSKVRAITRVATRESEDYLLMIARHGTASHVEQLVRAYRGVLREADGERAKRQHEQRSLAWHYDEHGALVIEAHLPAEQGALVVKALEAVRERVDAEREVQASDAGDELRARRAAHRREPFGARRADALVEMAERALGADDVRSTGGDRTQVVVHVDAGVLARREHTGRCELEHGPWLTTETARRLACDASVVRIVDGPDGAPLDVGRKTRSIPSAIRRALAARDGGCRFPGCTHERFVDAHHVEHWADGGETRLGNLVTLCKRHHRLMHEGELDVRVLDDGALRFTRGDGRAVPAAGNVTAETCASVAALVAANREAGLEIDPQTGRCLWDGVQMDLAMAVDALLRSDGLL